MSVLAALGLMLAGCVSTRPPEEYPGLANASSVPRDQMCTVREADHCYVGYVGNNYVSQYDVNAISPATYRQWLIPPGQHVIAVYFRQQRNLETISGGPRFVTLDAQPGHTYELRSGTNGADVWFADNVRLANWRPAVIDAKSGQQVAITDINR